MKAIITKYLPYTATRPSRIKATSPDTGKSLTLSVDSVENGTEDHQHKQVAKSFAAKMNWTGADSLVGGWLGGGSYAFVFTDR